MPTIEDSAMATAQPSTTSPLSSSTRTFPRPDTALARVIGDRAFRRAFHRRLQASNRFIVFFYRIGLLPLLGAARGMMLLTTVGRKSGQLRSFPVGYFRLGGEIYQISGWGKNSNWYKNIQTNPESVKLLIGLRAFDARAEFIEAPSDVQDVLKQLISESPKEAKRILGWDPSIDRLESTDFGPVSSKIMFVHYIPFT